MQPHKVDAITLALTGGIPYFYCSKCGYDQASDPQARKELQKVLQKLQNVDNSN